MRQKKTLQQLKNLFPPLLPDEIDLYINSRATNKYHKHEHQPAAKPKSGKITPAQYRRGHRGRTKA